MIILGIETSCDETAAALLEVSHSRVKVLSNVVASSTKLQAKYGGIVPEVAARVQMKLMIPVLEQTVNNLQLTTNSKNKKLNVRSQLSDVVTAIAVTVGPGLATSLQVGIDTAKTLAYVWQKPLIPVNHLEGHLLSPLLAGVREIPNYKFQIPNKSQLPNSKFKTLAKIKFPAITLIVSGGHTELILVKDYLKYKLLGRTRDDAAGEAFDKVAKLLGLGYPGGPNISKLAKKGNPQTFEFPRGMVDSGDFDFSFSGLKTAVLYKTKELGNNKTMKQLNNLCSSFQQAVVDVLVAKTMKTIKEYKAKTLLVGGGVIANQQLRKVLMKKSKKLNVNCQLSSVCFSGDNAAMIALAGFLRYKSGHYTKPNPQTKSWQRIKPEPNLRLV